MIENHLSQKTKAVPRSGRCLRPPVIEGCNNLLLLWSFIPNANQCEQGFVCYKQPNSFSTREECEIACPRVPNRRPPVRILGCRYWLLHLNLCEKNWPSSRRDIFGKTHDLTVFTGCGEWKKRVYIYDLLTKRCRVKPWWWKLPPEKKVFADDFHPVLDPVVTTFQSIDVPNQPFIPSRGQFPSSWNLDY
ncbi:uncharacterized protein LOC119465289 isoform X1 [Dermacentor silvarum]|uniref:uncharacterized protein LOC119465289 isoform X1 n=1 Tax=Dermacentor silvarum TaxID=543639 RepID=UPI0021014074|nr:uncharacterized protein LOC119465289 isoform X1 [Dermacentor silvarum]